jgi:hypothetical protein
MPFPARTPLPSARGNNTPAAPSKIPALCAVAHELATLLDRETALIRAMRIQEIAPLQGDKARLKAVRHDAAIDRSGGAGLRRAQGPMARGEQKARRCRHRQ